MKLHYDDWDGGTEADQDMPEQVLFSTPTIGRKDRP